LWRVRPEPCSAPSRRGLFSDLTDAQWSFLEPLLLISSNEDRNTETTYPRRRCDALHLAHRVPMAFPTRGVRPWTRVWSQFRRWSKNGTWSRVLTALHARRARRSAERHRDPRWSLSTRTSLAGFERRCDLSQPGGPYGRTTAPNGSSASTSRACHSACESSRCDLRGQCRRTDTRRPRPLGRGRTTGARAR